MGQVISYEAARAMRACSSISSSAQAILRSLNRLSKDTAKARVQLENAGIRLEKSIAQFEDAQRRLRELQQSHLQTMALIDDIQGRSIAFKGIAPSAPLS